MLCIDNPYTHPYFNLAAEEYLFKTVKENVLMLWQNNPTVVIGKHQDAAQEINARLAARQGIRLVRRLTGGGAVYHDRGNFNLSLIGDRYLTGNDRLLVTLRDFLRSLGVEAWMDERKNIRVGSRKVSGSAQGVYKDRWLCHATLLFSSDLETLQAVLEPDGEIPSDGNAVSVSSVKSPVANLCDYLPPAVTFAYFRRSLFHYLSGSFPNPHPYIFTPADLSAIRRLKEDKYETRVWNYRVGGNKSLLVSRFKPLLSLV